MRIVAISGSLRRVSSNTTLLRAAALLAPAGMEIRLYEGIGDLPHFNPDLEGTEDEPESVRDFRARLREADGMLISSPEYAHGVPGVLKNALDWVVGSGELSFGKPVALLSASPYSTYAPAQLRETITTMDAYLVPEAAVAVPLMGKKLDEAGVAAHPELAPVIRRSLEAFARAIDERPGDPPK
jgi:NAD(P)H-dependent FMN reductase